MCSTSRDKTSTPGATGEHGMDECCREVRRFRRATDGATAIEYSLIAALIAVAMIAGASKIDPGFDEVEGKISEAIDLSE